MNDYSTEQQRIISFCTGYAGIELGLERAGINIQPVAYVEREGYVCANLVSKIEQGKLGTAPIFTDVKSFPARYFSGKVHGIIGGYPCQPFSTAGKRCGADDPRHLWPYILQHIRTIRPIWCLFENVSGHLTLGYEKVQEDLHEAGYLVEAGLFTASEVGAPHKRERLFILAYTEQQRLRGRGDGIPAGLRGQIQAERPSELGNTEDLRLQEQCQTGRNQVEFNGTDKKYPARPGQPQYDWEEPRTLEPAVGGAANGYSSWVDEIRMCGNGVVPETAAKAWMILNKRLFEGQK